MKARLPYKVVLEVVGKEYQLEQVLAFVVGEDTIYIIVGHYKHEVELVWEVALLGQYIVEQVEVILGPHVLFDQSKE